MGWDNLSAYVSWQSLTLVLAALSFAVFLVWKLRPTLSLPRLSLPTASQRARPRDRATLKAEILAFRDAARHAPTARKRAEALAQAALLAAQAPQGITSATGLYLRAMRADPTFGEAVRGISALLRRERPELLEAVLWRRLSHLDWDGDTREAARCAVESLSSLYRRELRYRDRARALHKLALRLELPKADPN
jgi:hypothetical protein